MYDKLTDSSTAFLRQRRLSHIVPRPMCICFSADAGRGFIIGAIRPCTHAVSGGRSEIAVSDWDLVPERGLASTFPCNAIHHAPICGQWWKLERNIETQ